MGTVMTVMVISLMIIISIDTIITRIWQHAGSLLPASVLCLYLYCTMCCTHTCTVTVRVP